MSSYNDISVNREFRTERCHYSSSKLTTNAHLKDFSQQEKERYFVVPVDRGL